MIRKIYCNRYKKKAVGMTLIELMISVAVIGILAGITYPSYQNYVLKAHRSSAMADLSKIQLEMERQYNGNYVSAANSVLSGGICTFCEVDSARYTITIAKTATTYTISATAAGAQTNDKCGASSYTALTLNQVGEGSPANCWK